MKNLTFILAVCFAMLTGNLHAQYVTVNDTAFVRYLTFAYPTCMSGNQMDTTCTDIVNATRFELVDNSFRWGANLVDITEIKYFKNLEQFYLYTAPYFQVLPPLPATVTEIVVDSTRLNTVSALPPDLTYLWFENNAALTSVPALPATLTYFNVVGTNVSSLPSLPANLETLLFGGFPGFSSPISSMPLLPAGLKELTVYNTNITNISTLPSTLEHLDLTSNNLGVLPNLPSTLTYLSCSDANLTALPALPNGLTLLYCSHNNISFLPTLPNSLQRLWCEFNNLTSLPTMPNALEELYCSNNNLTSLPSMPASLDDLYCQNNSITSLPSLPNKLTQMLISNNPITCLPDIDTITVLYFQNTDITCRSNANLRVFGGVPSYGALPVCDVYDSTYCGQFANISGKLYLDGNNNCSLDSWEVKLSGINVKLLQNGQVVQQTTTNAVGYYGFVLQSPNGSYQVEIDPTLLSYAVACGSGSTQTVSLSTGNPAATSTNFGLSCGGAFDVGVHNIVPPTGWVRPTSIQTVKILAGDLSNLTRSQCAAGRSGEVKVIMRGAASNLSSVGAISPSSVSGDTITWNISNFATTNLQSSFIVSFRIDTFATLNDSVCFDVYVSSTNVDAEPSNDQLSICIQVQTSYDPNDKQVSPLSDIDTSQKWLYYHIRFQNTGTAPAQHVKVTDQLSTHLDKSTFQVLSASHDHVTDVTQSGLVNFNFPNIELPDSNFDEPNSHGYISYKIKLKDNRPVGTIIRNTAYIYFDYNPAIVTNTTENTIVVPIAKPTITANSFSGCDGDTIDLETAYNPAYTYTWYINDTAIVNTNSNTLQATRSGSYKVGITDGIINETSDVQLVTLNPLPVATLTAATNSVCEDASAVMLTPSPVGGAYTGATITGNEFDPATNSIGLNTIEYLYTDGNGCADNATVDITVNAKPTVTLVAAANAICEDAPAVMLTPSPVGGAYTGATVTANEFDPAANSIGLNTIEYLYTDGNGCADNATVDITVNAKPTVTLVAAANAICEDAPAVTLTPSPAGGAYTGATITGNDFDPAANSIGLNTIEYLYTDGNGCADNATVDITVNAKPTVTLVAAANAICEDAPAVMLTPSPVGGTYTGATITGNEFDPAANSIGLNTIEYLYTDGNGCADNATVDITVNEKPNVTLSLPTDPFCEGATPADLSAYGTPAGGTYSGAGVSNGMLDLTVANTYNVTYNYTNNNGCSDTKQASAVVEVCIGVEELEALGIKVYPNPASNTIWLEYTSSPKGHNVSLLDLTGKTVAQATATSNGFMVNVSELPSEMYFLVVKDAKGQIISSTKITVQH